jgi:hypothetical protein
VIRVRYKDQLTRGLNGTAEHGARGTTVYLVPGLTGTQRREALRRLRQEASRGCGPALPGADLTVALAADRFRVGLRNTAAVVRLHPAGSLLPTALAGLLMTLFVIASLSAKMAAVPQVAAPSGPIGGGAVTVIGYPSLAQSPHANSHRAGAVSQPAAPWALEASSGTATPGHAKRQHRGQGVQKTCGPAGDRAGDADRAPGTGRDAACQPASQLRRLPWPPPAGGWPHFWRPQRATPLGGRATR